MRRTISLLLLAALLLGGCGRAGTVATEAPDPMEAVLRLFYPCSLVRSTDGQWYTQRSTSSLRRVVIPVQAGSARDDNPMLRIRVAGPVQAAEELVVPLQIENDTGLPTPDLNFVNGQWLEGPWLEYQVGEDWCCVAAECANAELAGIFPRLPAGEQSCNLRLSVLGERADAAERLGYAQAPCVPPAGHYRLLWCFEPPRLAPAYADYQRENPELCDPETGRFRFLLTAEFDIVA